MWQRCWCSAMQHEEIIRWLSGSNDEELFARADAVRRDMWGDGVLVRGIVELSNYCVRNCYYCGLRRENTNLTRYRLTHDDVLHATAQLYADGIRTVVLQSGDDMGLTGGWVAELIRGIKQRWPAVCVTLSLGERSDEDYRTWRAAGADRYLLKHETADAALYTRLHPGQSLAQRVRILEFLRSLGYEIGAGCIVGLPGQTLDSLAQDIRFLQQLQPEMAGIGPFIPHAATPLANAAPGAVLLTLRVLAVVRLVAPRTRVPATTALGSLAPEDGLVRGLRAGCNVLMCDYTPIRERALYHIYEGKRPITLERAHKAAAAAGRWLCLASPDESYSEV